MRELFLWDIPDYIAASGAGIAIKELQTVLALLNRITNEFGTVFREYLLLRHGRWHTELPIIRVGGLSITEGPDIH